MAGVRFTELQSRPLEFLDCTSVTLDEFQQLVPPLVEGEPTPGVAVPAAAPAPPLLPMTAPHGASSAPKALLHRRRVTVARQRTTPSKMSCESMGFDHGVGHPLLLLCNAKTPRGQKVK